MVDDQIMEVWEGFRRAMLGVLSPWFEHAAEVLWPFIQSGEVIHLQDGELEPIAPRTAEDWDAGLGIH